MPTALEDAPEFQGIEYLIFHATDPACVFRSSRNFVQQFQAIGNYSYRKARRQKWSSDHPARNGGRAVCVSYVSLLNMNKLSTFYSDQAQKTGVGPAKW